MAAVSRMSNPERVVITAVLAGVLRIDDQGRVWRNTKRGEVRAEKKLPNGYLQVRWMTGGVRYCAGAHRLVWQSVHGDITDGMTINHKNGLRDQNNIGNLEASADHRTHPARSAVTWAAPSTPPHRRAKACAVAPKVLGPPPALRMPGPAAAAC